MDKKNAIVQIFRKKNCHICKHVLSVPPITTEGTDKEVYKCGRCKDISFRSTNSHYYHHQVPTPYRMHLLEEIAQHLSFPCSFPECHKVVSWNNAERHERDCRYRTIRCPMHRTGQDCVEMIRMDNLEIHFQEKHRHLIRKFDSILQVDNNTDAVLLLQAGDEYFILHILKQGSIAVLAPKKTDYNTFNVKLSLPNKRNFTLSFEDLPVVRYNERIHCAVCIERACKELHHPYSQLNCNYSNKQMNLDNFVVLQNELTSGLNSFRGTLRYIIKLGAKPEPSSSKKQTDDEDEEEGEETCVAKKMQSPDNFESLKRGLSCPYCICYLEPPIYSCVTGHTVCHKCKSRLEKCPTCSSPFGTNRIFTLEEMVREIEVPCENIGQGCNFWSTVLEMSDHETICVPSKVKDKLKPKLKSSV